MMSATVSCDRGDRVIGAAHRSISRVLQTWRKRNPLVGSSHGRNAPQAAIRRSSIRSPGRRGRAGLRNFGISRLRDFAVLRLMISAKFGRLPSDHLRALAQRIEVDTKEVRIMGSTSVLLRTLVATSREKTAVFGVPGFENGAPKRFELLPPDSQSGLDH